MTLFLVSFLQVIIEISFTMHEHLHSLSDNTSGIVGVRDLFKSWLIHLQFWVNIWLIWLGNLSLWPKKEERLAAIFNPNELAYEYA